ncbi:hypothetical protein K438DRAFT_1773977 [Mycena galopus ATCC 62051]|nr:hypothetical protein K438DRAFT_1773977 [Mycena galopus ATCC 62051]
MTSSQSRELQAMKDAVNKKIFHLQTAKMRLDWLYNFTVPRFCACFMIRMTRSISKHICEYFLLSARKTIKSSRRLGYYGFLWKNGNPEMCHNGNPSTLYILTVNFRGDMSIVAKDSTRNPSLTYPEDVREEQAKCGKYHVSQGHALPALLWVIMPWMPTSQDLPVEFFAYHLQSGNIEYVLAQAMIYLGACTDGYIQCFEEPDWAAHQAYNYQIRLNCLAWNTAWAAQQQREMEAADLHL